MENGLFDSSTSKDTRIVFTECVFLLQRRGQWSSANQYRWQFDEQNPLNHQCWKKMNLSKRTETTGWRRKAGERNKKCTFCSTSENSPSRWALLYLCHPCRKWRRTKCASRRASESGIIRPNRLGFWFVESRSRFEVLQVTPRVLGFDHNQKVPVEYTVTPKTETETLLVTPKVSHFRNITW